MGGAGTVSCLFGEGRGVGNCPSCVGMGGGGWIGIGERGEGRHLIYEQAVSLTILSASRLCIANNGCAVAVSTALGVFSAAEARVRQAGG